MKRDIKFRAWDDGKMIYEKDIIHLSNEDFLILRLAKFWSNIRNDSHIMQYTGLHDKNGKEIYEGDIIIASMGEIGIIVWNENVLAFQYAYRAIGKGTAIDGKMTNTLYKYKCKTYEVIGNIYENPELINQ